MKRSKRRGCAISKLRRFEALEFRHSEYVFEFLNLGIVSARNFEASELGARLRYLENSKFGNFEIAAVRSAEAWAFWNLESPNIRSSEISKLRSFQASKSQTWLCMFEASGETSTFCICENTRFRKFEIVKLRGFGLLKWRDVETSTLRSRWTQRLRNLEVAKFGDSDFSKFWR